MLLTELILELDRRVRELYGILLRNREVRLENAKGAQEIKALEQEMTDTIASYQTILNTDPAHFAEEQVASIRKELNKNIESKKRLRGQCGEIETQISGYRKDIAQLEQNAVLA
jgi:uncharacterized protein YhaN